VPCFALRLRSLAAWTQYLVSTACFDAQVHYGVDLGTKSPNLSSDWVGQNHCRIDTVGWLGSRVVSVLDSGAEGLGFKIAVATLSGTAHTNCASVHQAAKFVAALLRVAGVTAGLAKSNGSLPLGL